MRACRHCTPLVVRECEVSEDDGSTWSVLRIGELSSQGGYDFWQFAWEDAFDFSSKLAQHPEGIAVLGTFSSGIAEGGHVLDYPPIHIHHYHLSPGRRAFSYLKPSQECHDHRPPFCGHSFTILAEQHGDYACVAAEGGNDCLNEALPGGFFKLATEQMTVWAELNDVRASGSPPLKWWWQLGVRWMPAAHQAARAMRPLSLHTAYSPGRWERNDQSTMVVTFLVPTHTDSLVWYTGRFWGSGTLVRAKLHAHNTLFEESFFFAATPAQLCMDGAAYLPRRTQDPIPVGRLGFDSAASLRDHIRSCHARAQTAHGATTPFPPTLVCHANTSHESVGGYDFDRRSPTWCRDYRFKLGQQFTVLGIHKRARGPIGPHAPEFIPDHVPGHIHWFWSWVPDDQVAASKSHYSYGFYTQDVDWSISKDLEHSHVFDPFLAHTNLPTLPLLLSIQQGGAFPPSKRFFWAVALACAATVTAGVLATVALARRTYHGYKLIIGKQ